MAIKIRKYKKGGLEVDITVHMPDGKTGSRAPQGARDVEVGRAALGRRARARALV